MRTWLRGRGDQGETLIEILVAITILGVCVVAIGAGIVSSVRISQVHRVQALADNYLHAYAETVEGNYQACPSGAANYQGLLSAPSSQFQSPAAVTVKYWNSATRAFDLVSCPGTDPGVQQVTLTLTSVNGFVSESLVVVTRNRS